MKKGSKMSPEACEKIRQASLKQWADPEKKAKLLVAHKGTTGKKYSAEAKAKMSSWQIGRKMSEEAKLKMSLAKRGEKSPNWKGGVTKQGAKIRSTPQHKEWSNAVRLRDNFICQNISCGFRPEMIAGKARKRMHAHHILSFSEFPNLRHDVNNGITLCKKCHRAYHFKNEVLHLNAPLDQPVKCAENIHWIVQVNKPIIAPQPVQ